MVDQVDVWRVSLDRAAAEYSDRLATLSDDEQTRAARFAHHRDRAAYVMTRSELRAQIGARLGRSAVALRFRSEPGGRPVLADAPGVRFSVSHSGNWVLIALAEEREVGVDVEAWSPVWPAEIADQVLGPEERARVGSAPHPTASFYEYWTLKEALLKARGTGLAERPDEVLVTPNKPQRIDNFFLRPLPIEEGYSAALAVECLGAGEAEIVMHQP